jgi:phosphate starvation-inducible PhoH-like protein
MSKRRKAQAYIEQAHTTFINETAKIQSLNGKIETTKYIRSANVHQKQFVKSIKNNILTLGSGEAGCGKTLLALFTGVQLINNKDSPIEKILYVRANIEDREEKEIGLIPGELLEKTKHLAYPILDNLEMFMKKEAVEFALTSCKIEVLPFQMMRGRSFHNTFIILDETQNATKKQLKTLMTRLCETSKLVIIGDPSQCDIDPFKNGLIDLEWRLNKKLNIPITEETKYQAQVDFSIIHFDYDDILRSELTKFAIDLYNIT